jgi:hypothetical protein
MISMMTCTKMTNLSAAVSCLSRFGLPGTGMPAGISAFGIGMPVTGERRLGGRTIPVPAVAAAQAAAYALAAANGAESRTKQRHEAWALRGLEPWSHPA